MNCNETMELRACTDGCINPACFQWYIEPQSSIGSTIVTNPDGTALFTAGCDCYNLTQETIVVRDQCNGLVSDNLTVSIGSVLLDVQDASGFPGDNGVPVKVTMTNNDKAVKAVQVDLTDECDYLTCTGCQPDPDRAGNFMCAAQEQPDGSCRVVLVSTNPAAMIREGEGTIFTVNYDLRDDIPASACCGIGLQNMVVSDRFGDALSVCSEEGVICPFVCGDLYPRECLPDNPICGDGVINIFDILEEIDIALGMVTPSDCQIGRADVPSGTPPYCTPPDGVIDILDVLVVIDRALGKPNCCDYYYLGKIY